MIKTEADLAKLTARQREVLTAIVRQLSKEKASQFMDIAEAITDIDAVTLLRAYTTVQEVLSKLESSSASSISPTLASLADVIGDEVDWSDMVLMFAGSGRDWDGAAFFPVTAETGGPLDNLFARLKLRTLEARLAEDRLVLNEGTFFDRFGRRLMIEEVTP